MGEFIKINDSTILNTDQIAQVIRCNESYDMSYSLWRPMLEECGENLVDLAHFHMKDGSTHTAYCAIYEKEETETEDEWFKKYQECIDSFFDESLKNILGVKIDLSHFGEWIL
jgi:hypothetical protein